MGRGILGPVIARAPVGGGRALITRNADMPGVACEVHHLPELSMATVMELLRRPQGVDICADCIHRVGRRRP